VSLYSAEYALAPPLVWTIRVIGPVCESAEDMILPGQAVLTYTEVAREVADPDVTGSSSEPDGIRAAADAKWLHPGRRLIVVTIAAAAVMPPAVGVGLGVAAGVAWGA
jgi:hypothetical protein